MANGKDFQKAATPAPLQTNQEKKAEKRDKKNRPKRE